MLGSHHSIGSINDVNVMRMVVGMLLGVPNKIFRFGSSEWTYKSRVYVRKVTEYDTEFYSTSNSNLNSNSLASTEENNHSKISMKCLRNILKWFAELGSILQSCRTFCENLSILKSCKSSAKYVKLYKMNQSLIDTFSALLSDMLTSFNEEFQLVDLLLFTKTSFQSHAQAQAKHITTTTERSRRKAELNNVTLLTLMKQLEPWQKLFLSCYNIRKTILNCYRNMLDSQSGAGAGAGALDESERIKSKMAHHKEISAIKHRYFIRGFFCELRGIIESASLLHNCILDSDSNSNSNSKMLKAYNSGSPKHFSFSHNSAVNINPNIFE